MTTIQRESNNTKSTRKESTDLEKETTDLKKEPFDPMSIQFCQPIHEDENPDCKCGCEPTGLPPSLFEMAQLRKEFREREMKNAQNR